MVKIRIKHGLDVPFACPAKEDIVISPVATGIALDLSPFSKKSRLRSNVEIGDRVLLGGTLAHDTHLNERIFTSPAAGTVTDIVRGEKRRLMSIVIRKDENEKQVERPPISLNASKEEILDALFSSGLSPFLLSRPFNKLISKTKMPRAIFINTIASSPLSHSHVYTLFNENETFQKGLTLLSKIAKCHLISQGSPFDQFTDVTHHTAFGPHPVGLPSVHIENISPIKDPDDCIWTIEVDGVISIGALLGEGRYHTNRTIGLTGPGFKEEDRKLYRVRAGCEISPLIESRLMENVDRVIVGDALTGTTGKTHLGFSDLQICALMKPKPRRILPFIRIGSPNFTSHRTYLRKKTYDFSARMLGEERPIVDGSLYQKVMPLSIPVEPFIKALLAKDFEMALDLGLLSVVPEDFSLCEFICPSKVSFTSIVEKGIAEYLELYAT